MSDLKEPQKWQHFLLCRKKIFHVSKSILAKCYQKIHIFFSFYFFYSPPFTQKFDMIVKNMEDRSNKLEK